MRRNYFSKVKPFFCKIPLAVTAISFFVGIIRPAFCEPQTKTAPDLVILFTHDLHSNLEEYAMPEASGSVSVGGYARLATAVKRERLGKEQNTLLLDAGDFSMGTLFHVIDSEASPELRVMGVIGYDATTLGNHEFDFGPDKLASILITAKKYAKHKLPAIVASNMVTSPHLKELAYFRKACRDYPVLPYKIIERSGLKIGIFGLMGQEAAFYVPEAKPVRFSSPVEAAAAVVDVLREREKVDLVICLSHSGTWPDKRISEDEILASRVPGIDVIISGHTHTVLNHYLYIGKTYIVSAGSFGRYLGRLELSKSSALGFSAVGYRLIPITDKFPKDKEVYLLIQSFKKEINRDYLKAFGYYYGEPLAYLPFPLTDFNWGANSREKLVTSGLGDLVTDAFLYAAKKAEGKSYRDISLVVEAFGQIRVPLARGIITVNDVFRLMSLGFGPDTRAGAPLVAFWLTGKEIRNFLELETTLAPIREDMHLQISGMRFSYDSQAPEFERIQKVEVETANGKREPLDDNRLYRVCTNWKTMLMGETVKKLYKRKLEFVPKDVNGNPITDMKSAIIYFAKKPPVELKEWLALALYLKSLPPGKSGLPEIPGKYRMPRVTVEKSR